jgi:hypothetical protein
MNRICKTFGGLALILLYWLAHLGAQNAFSGTWKSDPARHPSGLGPSLRTLCPLMEENIFPTIGVVNTILQLTARDNCHRNARVYCITQLTR